MYLHVCVCVCCILVNRGLTILLLKENNSMNTKKKGEESRTQGCVIM